MRISSKTKLLYIPLSFNNVECFIYFLKDRTHPLHFINSQQYKWLYVIRESPRISTSMRKSFIDLLESEINLHTNESFFNISKIPANFRINYCTCIGVQVKKKCLLCVCHEKEVVQPQPEFELVHKLMKCVHRKSQK